MLPKSPIQMAMVFLQIADLPSEREELEVEEVLEVAEAIIGLNAAFRRWADKVAQRSDCPSEEPKRSEFILTVWDKKSPVGLTDFLEGIGALPEDDEEENEDEDWGDDLAPFGSIGWK